MHWEDYGHRLTFTEAGGRLVPAALARLTCGSNLTPRQDIGFSFLERLGKTDAWFPQASAKELESLRCCAIVNPAAARGGAPLWPKACSLAPEAWPSMSGGPGPKGTPPTWPRMQPSKVIRTSWR